MFELAWALSPRLTLPWKKAQLDEKIDNMLLVLLQCELDLYHMTIAGPLYNQTVKNVSDALHKIIEDLN